MTTTIEDAKAAKGALEHTIAMALRQFTADTGCRVEHVMVDPLPGLGEPMRYRVDVEARL